MSIRIRLALFGVLVVTLTLTAFTVTLYALFSTAGTNEQDRQLSQRAEQAIAALSTAGAEEFQPRTFPAPIDPSDSIDVFTLLLASDGSPLSASGEIAGRAPSIPADVLAAATAGGETATTIEAAPGVRLRVHVRPWSRPDLGLSGHFVAAQSTERTQNDARGARIFLIAAAIFAFVIASFAIWLVVGRALRPLRQLAALTDDVAENQDLGRRLPVPAAHDELRRLSESFNGMMSRLEESQCHLSEALESQKRFVADASHELRTPLTTIRGNAGFLLQHPEAQTEDRQAALKDIADESERMSRLIQDLLTLARADGGFHFEKSRFDLADVVRDVARQAAMLHTDRQIRADAGPAAFDGNPDALKQLLWILLDNAVKHTRSDGRIRLALSRREDHIELLVADDGEGIPAADLPRVFDRFYQVDAARSKDGSGLGLSIAAWIVEEHGGTVAAHNNDHGGATIAVELPVTPGETMETSPAGEAALPVPDTAPPLTEPSA